MMKHRMLDNPTKIDYVFSDGEIRDIEALKIQIEMGLQPRLVTLPVKLQSIIMSNGILTGGMSSSYLHGNTPNDFDIFLNTREAIDEFTMELKFNGLIDELVSDVNPRYMCETLVHGKLITPNAITFKNGIQVICMNTSDARETFDFIHCQPYYKLKEYKYYISKEQYTALKTKTLVSNKSPKATPVTKKRLDKFIARGWTWNE